MTRRSAARDAGAPCAAWSSLLAALLLLPLSGCLSFHKGAMPGEPKDATFAQVEGARVRFTDKGEGPPVVLLHGFASSLETWATVAPVLARSHRVVTLDLKGFGWTDRPEGDYSPAAQAKLVFALLDQRGIKDVAVVAHSWGSSVALAMALAEPARVRKIALYDAWVFEEQLPSFFLWARTDGVGEALFSAFYSERPDEKISHAFFDQRLVSQALVDEVERALERPGTSAAALAAVRGQRFSDVQTRYRTVKQPTLLLWGREDEVTLLPFGEQLARELPTSRLVVYPRCGHFPMLEAAAASTSELDKFLEETSAAPASAPSGASSAAPSVAPSAAPASPPSGSAAPSRGGPPDAAPAQEPRAKP
jgi:pimeloyl-ACP methyl ester carboxylesterase